MEMTNYIFLIFFFVSVNGDEVNECGRFCPDEVRAVLYQPMMLEKITQLKDYLGKTIDGLQALEEKTGEIPQAMKAKLGLEDDEIDNDTPEEMRQYLANILDSTLSADMRTWDRIIDTNLDILDPSRAPKAPKNLQDLKAEIENLSKTIAWSQESFEPLMKVVGKRLARVFKNLLKLMKPLMQYGGGKEAVMSKMRERSVDNFMGRILLNLVESKEDKIAMEELLFGNYKLNAENLQQDFYANARKMTLDNFWKKQLEKIEKEKLNEFSVMDDVSFASALIRIYLD